MTKAERIREAAALHPDLNASELARMHGWHDSYVRVVLRQRPHEGGESEIDRRYQEKTRAQFGIRAKSLQQRERYHSNPEFRQRLLDRNRAYKAKKREASHA